MLKRRRSSLEDPPQPSDEKPDAVSSRSNCFRLGWSYGAGRISPWQENPDIAAVDVTPIEPVDGGEIDFRGEKVKRPSRQTAIDMGLQEKHAALLQSLEGDKLSTADLKNALQVQKTAPWRRFRRRGRRCCKRRRYDTG